MTSYSSELPILRLCHVERWSMPRRQRRGSHLETTCAGIYPSVVVWGEIEAHREDIGGACWFRPWAHVGAQKWVGPAATSPPTYGYDQGAPPPL